MNTFTQLKFPRSRLIFDLCSKVAKRYAAFLDDAGIEYRYSTLLLDIEVCHANGCELDLYALLRADEAEFVHDISGIRRHLNRTTGQL